MSFVEISHNFVVRNFRLSKDVMKIAEGKADAEKLSALMQRKSNCRANYFASGIFQSLACVTLPPREYIFWKYAGIGRRLKQNAVGK